MHLSPDIPIIRIFSEAKARDVYVDFLGFSIEWQHRYGDDFPLLGWGKVMEVFDPFGNRIRFCELAKRDGGSVGVMLERET
ncbi:MAG: hypothetical protein JO371_12605 [Paraburkholderia sp.]|nr:hypothetical protein [Paraburkholderia sp.]